MKWIIKLYRRINFNFFQFYICSANWIIKLYHQIIGTNKNFIIFDDTIIFGSEFNKPIDTYYDILIKCKKIIFSNYTLDKIILNYYTTLFDNEHIKINYFSNFNLSIFN